VVLAPVEEPDEELVEGELVDDELSPLDSFFAAAPSDEPLDDEAPARLSVR
jgi:hypothetical protein